MLNPVIILGVLLIVQVHCNKYGFLDNPFKHWHDTDLFASESRLAPEIRDVEEVTEKDREPLAPDYKDPELVKPQNEKPQRPSAQRPPSYDPSLIPGGVIDVGTDVGTDDFSLGSFPHFPDNFGFGTTFGSGSSSRFPEGLFGLGGFFGPFAEHKPWWKGENVCVERQEFVDDEDNTEARNKKGSDVDKGFNFFSTSIRLSNCEDFLHKYECTTKINNHGVVKTFVVTYKCCYGFQRVQGTLGCTKKIDLVPLLNTIENVKATEFKNLIQKVGVEDRFVKENLTVFVPTNEALQEFSDIMNELNQISPARKRRQTQDSSSFKQLVLNHVVPGYFDISDVKHDDVTYSLNNNSLRFNIYPTSESEKLYTVNCVHIRKQNNLATNGIVHVIDGVLMPVTKSVMEIVAELPELSNFRQALQNSDLMKIFKPDRHYTIFAPTNEAFNKLGESAKQRLLEGRTCSSTILRHHIVPHTVCSAPINGNVTTRNLEGERLNLQRTDENVFLFENNIQIIKRDIVATDGVVHLINAIAIPESAYYISETLKKENFTKFLNLIEEAGLTGQIDLIQNVTLFAPSNEAFEDPDSNRVLEEVRNDKQKLKDLIMYHTVQGELETCNMNNNMQLKTKTDKNLRLNLYSTLPIFSSIINRATVNCARLTGFDEKSCGAMVHEVNKVLAPPTKSLLELVNSDENYKTLSKILNGTEVAEILNDSNQSLTLFAPSDDVFESLEQDQLYNLIDNKKKANAFLKNHILTEVLCCSGVGVQTFGFNTLFPTLSHNHHSVVRTSNSIRVGPAALTGCDNVGTNGVIHMVNKLLYPQSSHSPGIGFFIFDF